MIVALALAAIVAQCPEGAVTPCERALLDAGLRWEGRALEAREVTAGCVEKLATRTSTVIERLVPVDTPPVEEGFAAHHVVLIAGGTFVLGLMIGLTAGLALGTGPGVVIAR